MKKLQIFFDNTNKSLKLKDVIVKKIRANNFYIKDLAIVIGGDGFMLQTLKKNKNPKKKFYGINSGNYGFLMKIYSLKIHNFQN